MTETNRIEFKRELTRDLDIEREVVAFLNYHEGGVVYIGIDDNGKAVGVKDIDGDMLKIKDRIRKGISPSPMGLFDVTTERIDDAPVIKVFVATGSEKPYYKTKYGLSERGCFLRVGTASEPMTTKLIEDLYAKRVRQSLKNIPSPHKDLTFRQLHIYYDSLHLQLNKSFAKTLDLLTSDGEYNYVAYLLADTNSMSVKLAKYAGTLPFGMSKTDFFNGMSNPRNKELMRVFRDVDMVEALGTRMLRVLKVYKEENFVFMDSFIRVVIPYNWTPSELANGNPENKAMNVPENVLENVPENTVNNFKQLTERQQNIINRMIETGKTNVPGNVIVNVLETSASLAEYFGVNERTIRRDLRFLQEHNFLRHVGPDKGGHWEVIRTNEQQGVK